MEWNKFLEEVNEEISKQLNTNKELYKTPIYKVKRSLDRILNELDWISLSRQEKQRKRKSMLLILEESSAQNEQYEYERLVINLYDQLLKTYNFLISVLADNQHINFKGLFALIIIEMYSIDKNLRLKGIIHQDYEVFLDSIKNTECPEQFKDLKDALTKLHSQK